MLWNVPNQEEKTTKSINSLIKFFNSTFFKHDWLSLLLRILITLEQTILSNKKCSLTPLFCGVKLDTASLA